MRGPHGTIPQAVACLQVVLLLRLSPLLPLALSNYLYGLTSVDFVPYVLGSWLGMLPGTIAYVSAGGRRASSCAGRRGTACVSVAGLHRRISHCRVCRYAGISPAVWVLYPGRIKLPSYGRQPLVVSISHLSCTSLVMPLD